MGLLPWVTYYFFADNQVGIANDIAVLALARKPHIFSVPDKASGVNATA